MSHRVKLAEGKEKLAWEQHCQELNKAGLKVDTVSRWEKKRKAKQTKYQKFVDMLFKRGGHYEQKQKKKEAPVEGSVQ
jgi:hypothetical protein